jgi:ribonuclease J
MSTKLAEEVSKYTGPVFVLQAATNIDRIVTMYKVARKNNRLMLQDLYMSSITTALGGNIPNPVGFNTVYTYITTGYDDDNPRRKLFESLREYMVGKSRLADLDFIMNIRPSQLKYLQSLSESVDFSGGLLIMSMWSGYLDRPEFKKLVEFMENSDVKVIEGHVSGHADIETINRLISHTSPKETVVVHTEVGNVVSSI